jgi:prolyl-tRNA editing enzyme YbaK/EbsC (Cys-tRNA(Pro) deacylase)
MEHPVARAIRQLCAHEGVRYTELHHAPARSSADCAQARGTDVRSGGKALVMQVGNDFKLCVLSGALQVDLAALRAYFQTKKVRLASAAELEVLTGLQPGTVPPFGNPILPLNLFVDPSTLANPIIAFNLASLTCSMILALEDYVRIAHPTVCRFAAVA